MAAIRPQIITDPAVLEQIGFDSLRASLPGWQPNEADGATTMIRAHALMIAEERDVADDVPFEQILRPLGEKVHRILPVTAAAASVLATVTMRDTAGYTVPAGMEVLVKTAGDDGVTFMTTEAVVVEPGATATSRGAVTLRAMPGREGVAGNGLTAANDAVPIRSFEFIESITLEGTSSGGADAETDDAYLGRLTAELALTSPIPILTPDFAQLALRVGGVARALGLNLTQQVDEIIEVTGSSATAAGTLLDRTSSRSFTLTAAITATALANAFNAASPSGPRYQATATGGPLGTNPIVVTLRGRAAYGPWQLGSTVSGQSVTLTETQKGGDGSPWPRAVAVAVVDADGEPLSGSVKAEVAALLDGMREANWVTTVIDPTYTAIDVSFEAVTLPDQDPRAVEAAALAALADYLSPATWGTGPFGEQPGWVDRPVVRFLEIAAVLNAVPGLDYVAQLAIGLEGRVLSNANITMTGFAPLPRLGVNTTAEVTEG